ncbi:hypothetical protein EDC96DRAFT_542914 [Choanephora cucurbitarum]|nr:hypothetical protein EDC96DRAFT_542914 [Choanephora cucurbitarum]
MSKISIEGLVTVMKDRNTSDDDRNKRNVEDEGESEEADEETESESENDEVAVSQSQKRKSKQVFGETSRSHKKGQITIIHKIQEILDSSSRKSKISMFSKSKEFKFLLQEKPNFPS